MPDRLYTEEELDTLRAMPKRIDNPGSRWSEKPAGAPAHRQRSFKAHGKDGEQGIFEIPDYAQSLACESRSVETQGQAPRKPVIPAKAGIHFNQSLDSRFLPDFAKMTGNDALKETIQPSFVRNQVEIHQRQNIQDDDDFSCGIAHVALDGSRLTLARYNGPGHEHGDILYQSHIHRATEVRNRSMLRAFPVMPYQAQWPRSTELRLATGRLVRAYPGGTLTRWTSPASPGAPPNPLDIRNSRIPAGGAASEPTSGGCARRPELS